MHLGFERRVNIHRKGRYFKKQGHSVHDVGLIVDEVGFPKKGRHSACVDRQWLGCLGKQDNGQVSVGLSLCQGHLYNLINMQLFMPKSWANDPKRRKMASIPEEMEFKTKPEMAMAMVKKAIADGIEFGWVGCDALYGAKYEFIQELHQLGLTFMADVRTNQHVYLSKPNLFVPTTDPDKKGPKYKNLRTDTPSTKLDTYAKNLKPDDWQLLAFRDGTKGRINAYFHQATIWLWDQESPEPWQLTLIIRKDFEGGEIKFSFSNADPETSNLHQILSNNVAPQGQTKGRILPQTDDQIPIQPKFKPKGWEND
ncbi:MAG: IS701 family transposase [Bacteroidia bacterium]|nr:IS701 family transposase [Bacteroidia bacterium]